MERTTVRIGSRISASANAWLDKRSKETGLNKSTLINVAIDNYIQQTEVVANMSELNQILHKLEALEQKVGK